MATILCIDNEPSTRSLLQALLVDLGHQSVLARNMREGLQTLSQYSVDLVVSDSRMPDATGLDLLDELRRRGCGIPVIVMTGCPSLQHAIVSMQHGAVDYLAKPLSMETARTAVADALQVAPLRRAYADTRTGSAFGFRAAMDLRPPGGPGRDYRATGR